jgi:predicted SnoaL-like aldol condensation-catalyzing enzyme
MKSNKEIVLEFYEKVFNNWDLSELDDYMWDDYRQHSPEVQDGKAGFREFIRGFLSMKPHAEISKLIAEDDLVCVFFKCTFGVNDVVAKVFDLYRLKDGKLAEHWDCTMRVDGMECGHSNGQF